MPDRPTIAGAGVPGYDVYEWNVLAGTPPELVNKLHAEGKQVLDMKDVLRRTIAAR